MSESGGARTLLVAETVDDYAVALAVALAADALCAWAPVLCDRERPDVLPAGAVGLHAHVASNRLFSRDCWRVYQRLWYRWRSPRDTVAPMRWYLAALAGRSAGGSEAVSCEEISEGVDAWLQQQASLAPVDRAGHIREIAAVSDDATLVAGWGDSDTTIAAIALAAVCERPFLWSDTASELTQAIAAERGTVTVAHPGRPPQARAGGVERVDGELRRNEWLELLPRMTIEDLSLLAVGAGQVEQSSRTSKVAV